MAMLLQELEPFHEVVPAFYRAASMARNAAGDPSMHFAALIRHLRAAVDDLPWAIAPLSLAPRSPSTDENDYEAFLHFVAHACQEEDLCSLEVCAIITMTSITPHRALSYAVPC